MKRNKSRRAIVTMGEGRWILELPNGHIASTDNLSEIVQMFEELMEAGGAKVTCRKFGYYWVNAIKLLRLRPLMADEAVIQMGDGRTHGAWLINY